MATSTRLKGKQGFILSLKKGAAAAAQFGDDVKGFELEFEDKDDADLTFAEAAGGLGSDATLTLTAVTSFDAGSLFAYLWDNPGTDLVAVIGPWGNATPSTTKPHFTGTLNTGRKPGFSNEARTTEVGAEFEVELKFSTDVTKVTA